MIAIGCLQLVIRRLRNSAEVTMISISKNSAKLVIAGENISATIIDATSQRAIVSDFIELLAMCMNTVEPKVC